MKLDEGLVWRVAPGVDRPATARPRCAVAGSAIVCVFMAQRDMGSNDFMPLARRSTDGGRTWGVPAAVWPGPRD